MSSYEPGARGRSRSRRGCLRDLGGALTWLALGPVWALDAPAAAAGAFDAGTWREWRRQVDRSGRARLVVFSASWCAVCPGVIETLARDAGRRDAGVALSVVLTDLSIDDRQDPHAARHAGAADDWWVFDGVGAALRRSVDPDWRGVVPLVAWLAPGRPVVLVQGLPEEATRSTWWAAAGRAATRGGS